MASDPDTGTWQEKHSAALTEHNDEYAAVEEELHHKDVTVDRLQRELDAMRERTRRQADAAAAATPPEDHHSSQPPAAYLAHRSPQESTGRRDGGAFSCDDSRTAATAATTGEAVAKTAGTSARGVRRFIVVVVLAATLSWAAWYIAPLRARGPPLALPARPLNSTLKFILLWNKYFNIANLGFGKGKGRAVFLAANCPESRCYMTSDSSLMPEDQWDAVVFHAHHLNLQRFPHQNDRKLPSRRSPLQRYVFFLLESPANSGSSFDGLKNVFNWTMTYRADSDVQKPYGKVRPRPNATVPEEGWLQPPKPPPPTPPASADASDPTPRVEGPLVAWLVSNCDTVSRRQEYVKRLSDFVEVHIFGKCGRPWPKGGAAQKNFYRMLRGTYHFYLSFENSLCKDYVTEKFFGVLEHDIVPVVFGGANYSAIAPPSSYIDALRFPSARHLAIYLHWLYRHPDQYKKFFWWRHHYEVVNNPRDGLCQLCAMLHVDLPPKTYDDIGSWWHGGACFKPDTSHW